MAAAGVEQILDVARARAGLQRATCHQLRHTWFTRLREAGMKLEAIQAQAGGVDDVGARPHLPSQVRPGGVSLGLSATEDVRS